MAHRDGVMIMLLGVRTCSAMKDEFALGHNKDIIDYIIKLINYFSTDINKNINGK